ncbi:MAG TPA: ferredoxin [Actinospica sp.]|nr:ferredoxin [Actinospica sp.]
MKLTVHLDRCIGSGQCSMIAPAVFDQDQDTGSVILLDAEPAETEWNAVAEAVRVCPRQAISSALMREA